MFGDLNKVTGSVLRGERTLQDTRNENDDEFPRELWHALDKNSSNVRNIAISLQQSTIIVYLPILNIVYRDKKIKKAKLMFAMR